MAKVDLSIAIGGAAGQGIATPGDILARIFVRRGLHLNAYNAYQSIVRGGHIFLTLRTSDEPVLSFGDKLDIMIAAQSRHDESPPGPDEIGLRRALQRRQDQARRSCGRAFSSVRFSVKELAPKVRGDLVQNTIALAAVLRLIGVEFKILEDILTLAVQKKRRGCGRRKRRRGARRLRLCRRRISSRCRFRCRTPEKNSRSSKATRRWRWAARRRECAFIAPIR